jgi:hypothetical protein
MLSSASVGEPMSNQPWDFPEEEETPKPSNRPAGRPKGSTNKTMTQRLLLEQFEDLYGRVEHMLSDDQKKYYREAFKGNQPLDPVKEGELFARLYGVYVIVITTEALAKKAASKEVAENANQYRQMLKDIEEMTRKRNEVKAKTNELTDVVDPTRESTLARFQKLHSESS